MICRKKNGHLKMSLRVGGLLSLILSLVFSLFSSTLSASALSVNFDSYYGRYTDNWTSSQGQWTDSVTRYGLNNLANVVNANSGDFDFAVDKATPGWHPVGYSTLHFKTGNVNFSQNSLAFHAEINYVFSNRAYNYSYWDFPSPLNLNVISCNRDIASQNVSYHITDWTYAMPIPYGTAYYTNKTLTLYIDLALKNLPSGQSGNIFCAVDGGEPFALVMDSGANLQAKNTAFFVEKFDTALTFYSSLNDALQTATNNALQQQIQILEWQKQYQLELEEKERQREQQLQGISDDSTTDGNNASSDAQSATSSLLGSITSIYGTLLHPTTTNCNIGPINLYNQLDLGTLDMCTFSIPQPIFAIGALIMIGLVIMLAWAVLHSGMSLYKDLFGGK